MKKIAFTLILLLSFGSLNNPNDPYEKYGQFSYIAKKYFTEDKSRFISDTKKKYTKEVECLALNMYKEARGEPLEGLLAVALVTLNRTQAKDYPLSVCDVVYQKNIKACQFSWVCDRKIKSARLHEQTYVYIKSLASFIYDNRQNIKDITHGALFYHADYVKPIWRKKLEMTAKIGTHVFYK